MVNYFNIEDEKQQETVHTKQTVKDKVLATKHEMDNHGAFDSPVIHTLNKNNHHDDYEETPLPVKEKKVLDIARARKEYENIFVNNRLFVEETLKRDPKYFINRVKGQKPKYLFIGCSDSRVPAELILGLKPGELFVQRNIANLVVNTDINVLSVIQYAVDVLKVEHIIVCGHYGCGGVIASMENSDLGLIENWLRNIRDIYRLHYDELDKFDLETRKRKLVELNVREQCFNLSKISFVQHSVKNTGFPLIHGLVYELAEGIVKELDINIEKYREKFEKIYSLRKLSYSTNK